MNRRTRSHCNRALTIVELLVAAAVVSCLASILFPIAAQASLIRKTSNELNLRKIALAAIAYGDDYDHKIPLVCNGAYRNLRNTRDGILTSFGDKRTDLWPLLIVPYLQDRSAYVDPDRGDRAGIFSGPAHSSSDPGYDPSGATYRNQNRYPFFGMNYLFVSPLLIPSSKMSDASPTDFMVGEAHAFAEAEDPDNTVFFTPTMGGRVGQSAQDTYGKPRLDRGFFGVNAPGLFDVLSGLNVPYVDQWAGTVCSGDWCGRDIDPTTSGIQTNEGFFYQSSLADGNNTAFMDGHVRFTKTTDLAAGTNYLDASPSTTSLGGGAMITDRSKYIWNLNANFYGA